jgi:hypothetical protein
LSGGNGTPTWPEMKIQEPARVSMRNASLKVGAIGLGRCLRRSMALLPKVLLFSPPRPVREGRINRYLAETNDNPQPFTWTADPDAIIEKVRRANRR